MKWIDKHKLKKLKELRSKLNIKVKGLENYPQGPSLIVANHNCLLDIFSLPAALPEPTVSIVSSRVMYKNDKERKKLLNNYILPFPLERHAGRIYVEMCLNGVVELLKKGISANIFPEGGYYPKKKEVYRGKTGFTRVLFEARKSGVKVNLVPVSIKVYNDNLDIDSYQFNFDLVEVEILKPIDYEKYFELYCQSKDLTSKKNYAKINW